MKTFINSNHILVFKSLSSVSTNDASPKIINHPTCEHNIQKTFLHNDIQSGEITTGLPGRRFWAIINVTTILTNFLSINDKQVRSLLSQQSHGGLHCTNDSYYRFAGLLQGLHVICREWISPSVLNQQWHETSANLIVRTVAFIREYWPLNCYNCKPFPMQNAAAYFPFVNGRCLPCLLFECLRWFSASSKLARTVIAGRNNALVIGMRCASQFHSPCLTLFFALVISSQSFFPLNIFPTFTVRVKILGLGWD
jgi:hypothetical protein